RPPEASRVGWGGWSMTSGGQSSGVGRSLATSGGQSSGVGRLVDDLRRPVEWPGKDVGDLRRPVEWLERVSAELEGLAEDDLGAAFDGRIEVGLGREAERAAARLL